MKNENITGGFQKLKADLAGMTFREKAEHIWTYYRSWVIVAAAILVVLSILGSSFINLSTQTLLSGVSINVNFQDDVKEYMSTGMEALLQPANSRQKIYFETAYVDVDTDTENAYYLVQNMFSLMASQDLDYMILEKNDIGMLLTHDPFMDLTEFFTEEERKDLKIENVKATQDSREIPALVNISDWPIVKKSADSEKEYFFAVIANTPRAEAVKAVFNHIKAYGN